MSVAITVIVVLIVGWILYQKMAVKYHQFMEVRKTQALAAKAKRMAQETDAIEHKATALENYQTELDKKRRAQERLAKVEKQNQSTESPKGTK